MDLRDFDPTPLGLPSSFFLTNYTKLKGCGCKVPQAELHELLQGIGNGYIGMDSSIVPTKVPGVCLVQTTDFFYPLIEDPYLQGRITCANVLSDLYATGISECDNMLLLLGVCRDMDKDEQKIVTRRMIEGFNDLCNEAGTKLTGGQTVQSPWFLIGGVASCVMVQSEIPRPTRAQVGDVLVLTKPLGIQVAVNAHQWLRLPEKYEKIASVISKDEVLAAFNTAIHSMLRLNRVAAMLYRKYGGHACTDVTGFGILGHATNLANHQETAVAFSIHTLPIIPKMTTINECVDFRLLQGLSSETSGGLLIALPRDKADAFCREIEELEDCPAWIVGEVLDWKGNGPRAFLSSQPRILDAPYKTFRKHHLFET